MTREQACEFAIVLTGVAYVAASLIRGLQSPALGAMVIGSAVIKVLVSLWIRHGS